MMLIREPVKNWFGFTRRERRSSSILLLMIAVIIALRYVVPEQNIKVENWSSISSDTGGTGETSADNISSADIMFSFNPNLVPIDTLLMLGFTEREANTLIRYRIRGGKFKKPSDIRKVYGIDSSLAMNLEPYIMLPAEHRARDVAGSQVKERRLLNINDCDSSALVALPGIGPVLSARIIKYRYLLGGYARIEQLKEVYGLNEETFEMIKGRIVADSSRVRRININSADYRELSHIPYLEKYDVSAILKYRQLAGRVKNLEDLKVNKILLPEKADKAGVYMDFR